eukprot:NODE_55_length_29507_cov_0.809712.p1 type:complete len:839 gc:universal NODE_55_length_29507_cov_0.809712:7102-9618(+)
MNIKFHLPSESRQLLDPFLLKMHRHMLFNSQDTPFSRELISERTRFLNLNANCNNQHYTTELLQKIVGNQSETSAEYGINALWSPDEILDANFDFFIEIILEINNLSKAESVRNLEPKQDLNLILLQHFSISDIDTIGILDCKLLYKKLKDKLKSQGNKSSSLETFINYHRESKENEQTHIYRMVKSLYCLSECHREQENVEPFSIKSTISNLLYGHMDLEAVVDSISVFDRSFAQQLNLKKIVSSLVIQGFNILEEIHKIDHQIQRCLTLGKVVLPSSGIFEICANCWIRSINCGTSTAELMEETSIMSYQLSLLDLLNKLLERVDWKESTLIQNVEFVNNFIEILANIRKPIFFQFCQNFTEEIETKLCGMNAGKVKLSQVGIFLATMTRLKTCHIPILKTLFSINVFPFIWPNAAKLLIKATRKLESIASKQLMDYLSDFFEGQNYFNLEKHLTLVKFEPYKNKIFELFNISNLSLEIINSQETKVLFMEAIAISSDNNLGPILKNEGSILKKMSGDIRNYLSNNNLQQLVCYILDFIYLVKNLSRSENSLANNKQNFCYLLNPAIFFFPSGGECSKKIETILNNVASIFNLISVESSNPIDFWRKINHQLFFVASYYQILDLIQRKLIFGNQYSTQTLVNVHELLGKGFGKSKGGNAFSLYKERFLNSVLYYNQLSVTSYHKFHSEFCLKLLENNVESLENTEQIFEKSQKQDDLEVVERLTLELNECKSRLEELKLSTKLKLTSELKNCYVNSFEEFENIHTMCKTVSEDHIEDVRQQDFLQIIMKLKSLHTLKLFKLKNQNLKSAAQNREYIAYLKSLLSIKKSENRVNKLI